MLTSTSTNKSKLNINRLHFAIPLMATAGIMALGVGFINYNPEDFASATNSVNVTGTISYEDQFITISNNSQVDLGTMAVTADNTYAYATDNVTVSTNVPTGYDLYISSANKESADLTTDSSYTTIPATSGTGGDNGTPKVLDKNTYGYALPSGLSTNSGFDSDYSSPTSASKWAGVPAGSSDRIRTTTTATTGETTDIHYGARVTNALAPGQYSGQVIYSAVATPSGDNTVEMTISPSIGGTKNMLTIVSGPSNIDPDTQLDNSEVNVYFRQNDTTISTCEIVSIDTSNGYIKTTCTPTNLSIDTAYDVAITIPRYGFKDTVSDGYTVYKYMQDVTCSNYTLFDNTNETTIANTTYRAVDSRDYNLYHFRRLADGHCWMIQNLRLTGNSLTAAGHSRTLSSDDDDTNLSAGSFTIPNSTTWTDTSATGSYLVSATNAPIGSTNGSKADSDLAYARGVYYTWRAAVLDTTTISQKGVYKYNSVCPKGWQLPDGGGSSRTLRNIYSAYSSNYDETMKAFDYYYSNNYSASYYYTGYLKPTTSGGYIVGASNASYTFWWTNFSSNSSTTSAFYMYAAEDTISRNNGAIAMSNGLPIRCAI